MDDAQWRDTGNRKRVGVSYDDEDARPLAPVIYGQPTCCRCSTSGSRLGTSTREVNAKSSE